MNSCSNPIERDHDEKLYFAYGSNMNPERIAERLKRLPKAKMGCLKGYQLIFNKIASGKSGIGYANIVISKDDTVFGVLYYVTNEDLCILDDYEGVGNSHYYRAEVPIFTEESGVLLAITYIACQNRTTDSLKPTREYLNHLLEGRAFLPPDYIARLERITVATNERKTHEKTDIR